MRRYILLAALVIALGTCVSACKKVDETVTSNKSYMKEYFQQTFLRETLFCPVIAMSEREQADSTAIFIQGYHKDVKSEYGNMTIDKVYGQDSTWKVAGKYEKTEFEAIVRMTGRNKEGLCEWSATSSGKYDEQNGFTATMEFEIPASFYWKTTISPYSISYSLYCDGRYVLKTYKEGNLIESFDKTFTEQTLY